LEKDNASNSAAYCIPYEIFKKSLMIIRPTDCCFPLLLLYLILSVLHQLNSSVYIFKITSSVISILSLLFMTTGSQMLHIHKVLKRQGHTLEMLHNVFYAIIVNKIVYGISCWYSFLIKAQIVQINSIFKRAFKCGYLKSNITVEALLESSDDLLFHKASYGNHCLHHLLPAVAKSNNYELRDSVFTGLHKRAFVNRMIFSECYWLPHTCILVWYSCVLYVSLPSVLCCST